MKFQPLLLSSLLLILAGCGGGGGSSGSASNSGSATSNSGTGSAANGSSAAGSSSGGSNTSTAVKASATETMSCQSPATSSAAAGSALISADTPSADATRMFASGSTFQIAFTTNAPSADKLNWAVSDQLGNVAASGTFPVATGPVTSTLSCTSTLAGYFAASATLAANGGTLPSAGTRPSGIASFGVLPNLSGVVPAVTYAHQDEHRFGMQGENDNGALLADLGISSTIDNRQLSAMEPNAANTFNPAANNLDPFYTSGKVMRLIRLDGIPAWASPTGAFRTTPIRRPASRTIRTT